ncbi:MAG: peptidase M22 [Oscillospiraceae bacterium]|nr:peptidase M22 [Oscillospiraceae bacterium]
MSFYLGIDTSNYTTSAAIYDSRERQIFHVKKPLPVKPGELGLRQSDAVFHHTVALPEIVERLFESCRADINGLTAAGVSARPRDAEGSYMPCFLAGVSAARCIAAVNHLPLTLFSHQAGHVAAALYSAKKLELLSEKFIAFHVSGGTTEVLRVTPDSGDSVIRCEALLSTLDLKAGQAIDRVGKLLGMPFPSGQYVDELSRESGREYTFHIKLKDGHCSLSGLENKCESMKRAGESGADICRYCVEYIAAALDKMAEYVLQKEGDLPLVFSGGVTSNTLIRARFTGKYGAVFAESEFAADNAAGVALLAQCAMRELRIKNQ